MDFQLYLLTGRTATSTYHEIIPQNRPEIFAAMKRKDLAFTVRVATNILKTEQKIPLAVKTGKDNYRSSTLRNEGNKAYAALQYEKALALYNQALMYASPDSREFKLALGNRSAVTHKIEAYSACIADINMVMSKGCPEELVEKMKKRMEDCKKKLARGIRPGPSRQDPGIVATSKFFEKLSTNPRIPCVTEDIGVIVDPERKTVAAARDIKVGTLISRETANVSQLNDANKFLACSYCHKFILSLIPCPKCPNVLYCDDRCMNLAYEEYHKIECHITDVLECVPMAVRMAFKAAVKIKDQCKTWEKFIEHSYIFGTERIQYSTISEMYDSNNPLSLLCIDDYKNIVTGPMYNVAFDIAILVYYMEHNVPMYLPKGANKRNMAIGALGRTIMALSLYSVPTLMPVVADDTSDAVKYKPYNFGWFSFTSKLKNNCNPNVIPMVLFKEVVLISVKPIKKGTEITLPYIGHWIDMPMSKCDRRKSMFALTGQICACVVCSRDVVIPSSHPLTMLQFRNLRRLQMPEILSTFGPATIPTLFPRLCKTLAFLGDAPFSREFKEVYLLYRKCINYFQSVKYPQFFIDNFEAYMANATVYG